MPRRKSDSGRKIGNNSEDDIRHGITLIRNGMSIRQASKDVKVPFATLKRYYWKTKNAPSLEGQRLQPNYSVNKVFTETQEEHLKDYINYCALLFYGLTSKECRQLAYQCAQINKIKMPYSWQENEMAGKDWLIAFKRRHSLTTRRPEACSLARATSFNQKNVETFYENLENLISRNTAFADGTRIFNLDETSTTTVQKPQKVVAPKGRKCLGKVTSGERGTLVTTCCIISASGNALPPVMVFPRKNFKEHMIKNTPPGTLGLATPTGWMNSAIFPEVMKHFIKNTNATKENPCILIMDNHESHFCIEALNMAKDAGVHILTLHPHTSAKLQPLDVGIYGPFKVYYNAAIDSWLMRHPGKPITIYDLGEIIGIAFQKAMTPLNITKSFAKCGIHPFDKSIFTEEDYLPSSVTDRPCPDCAPREEGLSYTAPIVPKNPPHILESNRTDSNEMPAQSESDRNITDSLNLNEIAISACIKPATLQVQSYQIISQLLYKNPVDLPRVADTSTSSETLSPLHQEPQKVPSVETCVTTSPLHQEPSAEIVITTPSRLPLSNITEESINLQAARSPTATTSSTEFVSPFSFRNPIKAGPRNTNIKRRKAGRSLIATDTPEKLLIENEKNAVKQKKTTTKRKTIRKVLQSDEEEEEEQKEIKLTDSEEYSDEADQDDDENEIFMLTENHLTKPLCRPAVEGEYIIVQFVTKRLRLLYIGKVLEGRNNELEYYVSFLRRKPGTERFHVPDKPDLSVVKENDVKYILPKPLMVGTSSRPMYSFPIDLSSLKLR